MNINAIKGEYEMNVTNTNSELQILQIYEQMNFELFKTMTPDGHDHGSDKVIKAASHKLTHIFDCY